jgi:aquaporin Z
MKKTLTEFIGTFFLVLVICLTTSNPNGGTPMAPIAIGLTLMVMVYMGGHISGAHYNPAVTMAVLMLKRIELKEALGYWIFQIAGACAAAYVFWLVFHVNMHGPAPQTGFYHNIKPLMLEMLFTFALASVVLNSAVSKKTGGNSFYGLAIGATVTAGAFAAGPISGGAFNPAVGIGPNLVNAIMSGGSMHHVWIYIAGPLAGAVVAAMIFAFTNEKHEY